MFDSSHMFQHFIKVFHFLFQFTPYKVFEYSQVSTSEYLVIFQIL